MTIGIAVHGPSAGLAAFKALEAVERVGRGAIGGFASFVVITADGRLLRAETQRGGSGTLFTAGETTGVAPPPDYADAPFAALMSSGPDRPVPLSQFTPGRADAGLVSGHRLPNLPGPDGTPINQAVLESMARGASAPDAASAELERNPHQDAGIIALDARGRLFAGNTASVEERPDIGRAILHDPENGAVVAVLHNAIYPCLPLARLAATVALDAIAPADRADFSVRLDAGTPVELGAENCVFVDADNVATRIAVTQAGWLAGRRGGAVVSLAAQVCRGSELLGRATTEPYGIVEAGRVVSLSGAPSIELGVRAARDASRRAILAAD
jgi:hypothetical protein